jgi:WD40 repeat protein
VGFNFDGTLALTGSYDGTVRIWEVRTYSRMYDVLNMSNTSYMIVFVICITSYTIYNISHMHSIINLQHITYHVRR